VNASLVAVPLAALFVATASGLVLVRASLLRFISIRRAALGSATTHHALSLLLPWLLAALAALALASPNPFAPCHCTEHGLHHPHLCLTHPGFAGPLITPAGIVLGIWLLIVAPRVVRLLREVLAAIVWARTIQRLPLYKEDGVSFRIHDCDAPSAFTVGVWSPVIVIDRRLWARLSAEERRAVLHHEQGHVERRDGLTLLALRFCMALSPIPLGERFLAPWKSAAEKACDSHAASMLGDAMTVAAALVSVERIQREISPKNSFHPVPALGVVAGAQLEERVVALLDMQPNNGEQQLGNDVLAAGLMTLGAAAVILVWPGDTFHHATETLIGLLIH